MPYGRYCVAVPPENDGRCVVWTLVSSAEQQDDPVRQVGDLGTLTVRVTAADGNGGSVSGTFTITVIGNSHVEGNGIVEGGILFADGSSVADLPQRETVSIILAGVTKIGAPYTVIKAQTCTIGAGTCSGVFALSYDVEDIIPNNEYALFARIFNEEGRLIYINDTEHLVITSSDPYVTNTYDRDIEVVAVP